METFKFLLFVLGVGVAFYTFKKPKPKAKPEATEASRNQGPESKEP